MEVTGFGDINFDDYRFSSSFAVNNSENFTEILERIRSAESASQNDFSHVTSGTGKQSIDKNDRLYQLCLELETFIVKNLLNSMRNTVQKSGLINESFAGKMYEDMLYDEYAKDLAKNANFGLAEQAYRQLTNYR